MGFIPNDSVDIIYRSALASISSSMQEAYGLNNIEALREGTPLICTKTAGSDDILVEGTNGECLDVKKPKSLSDSLHKILTKWDFYSKNSLSTFEQNYSLKNIGSHYDKNQTSDSIKIQKFAIPSWYHQSPLNNHQHASRTCYLRPHRSPYDRRSGIASFFV